MANDLNRCEFIGRLGADPEMRYMPSGAGVANMRIACGRQWKDKNTGEKHEETEWVSLVAFGRLGEVCGEYLTKGSRIYAAGRMQTRKWQDREGNDRWSTEVVMEQMQMLDTKGSRGSKQPREKPQEQPQEDFDDDIPF